MCVPLKLKGYIKTCKDHNFWSLSYAILLTRPSLPAKNKFVWIFLLPLKKNLFFLCCHKRATKAPPQNSFTSEKSRTNVKNCENCENHWENLLRKKKWHWIWITKRVEQTEQQEELNFEFSFKKKERKKNQTNKILKKVFKKRAKSLWSVRILQKRWVQDNFLPKAGQFN